jgi:hypothetical protein
MHIFLALAFKAMDRPIAAAAQNMNKTMATNSDEKLGQAYAAAPSRKAKTGFTCEAWQDNFLCSQWHLSRLGHSTKRRKKRASGN